MGSQKQTAVNLSEKVQKIKDEFAPIYGLKNILSAGLILFDQLSGDDQKRAIERVHHGDNLSKILVADYIKKGVALIEEPDYRKKLRDLNHQIELDPDLLDADKGFLRLYMQQLESFAQEYRMQKNRNK